MILLVRSRVLLKLVSLAGTRLPKPVRPLLNEPMSQAQERSRPTLDRRGAMGHDRVEGGLFQRPWHQVVSPLQRNSSPLENEKPRAAAAAGCILFPPR